MQDDSETAPNADKPPTAGADSVSSVQAQEWIRELRQSLDLYWTAVRHGQPWGEGQAHLVQCFDCTAKLLAWEGLAQDGAVGRPLVDCIEWLEDNAREFFDDVDLDQAEVSRGLAAMRTLARLMRRLIRTYSGESPRNEIPFLLAELRDTENGFLVSQTIDADSHPEADVEQSTTAGLEATQEELANLRFQLLVAHAKGTLGETRPFESLGLSSADKIPALINSLEAVRLRLRQEWANLAPQDQQDCDRWTQQLETEDSRLRALFVQFCSEQDPEDRLQLWLTSAACTLQEVDEARSTAPDQLNLVALESLKRLGEHSREVLAELSKALAAGKGLESANAAKTLHRRLKTKTRRLEHTRNDGHLAVRLRGIFGARVVELWEGLIFWLIMGVLLLIAIDHYRTPPAGETIPWTAWVDTGICALLLLDFGVRWVLTRSKLSYFFRHVLTDVLPSLPFGLIVNLEHMAAMRSAMTLRVVRILRILRIARPFLRFLRLFLFLSRAADRLVDRNSWVLNRRIVFFSDPAARSEDPPELERIRDLESWIQSTTSDLFNDLDLDEQVDSAKWRVRMVQTELDSLGPASNAQAYTEQLRDDLPQELNVDDTIHFLRRLDASQIAAMLGFDLAHEIVTSMRLFRLPLMRKLPVIRFILGPAGSPDPLAATARLGRVMGDFLSLMQRALLWFSDLQGTITGPQFLDRFGLQMVQAAIRPAVRLLMFGALVSLFYALVNLTRLSFLDAPAAFLFDFLFKPVLFLGGICLVPLALGLWLRKIAGQVADFYDRVSDAQFLARTESVKERFTEEHLQYLTQRVLLPEATLEQHLSPEEKAEVFASVQHNFENPLVADQPAHPGHLDPGLVDSMDLFYREFLDGAFFHRNDTKVSSMLVGNLTLENIRRNRFGWSEKRISKLERFNLGGEKSGLVGPQIWCRFITQSVSHHTARLILDYNNHCIPAAEVDAADPEDRELYDAWLKTHRELSVARRTSSALPAPEADTPSATDGSLVYRTTEFNALHFLTVDPRRDRLVEQRFGAEVLSMLQEDRKYLIRDIFGTYPMHDLPLEARIFNPYEFYRKFFASGRVCLLPFHSFWFGCKGIRLILSRVVHIVRDVIHPHERPARLSFGHAGFDVARRKVHRMRRPVAMECLRLRAQFDIEFLGIVLPGQLQLATQEDSLVNDLQMLHASQREWEEFRQLKSTRQQQMRLLSSMLQLVLPQGKNLAQGLLELRPRLEGKQHSSLRAMALAFACDHKHSLSISHATRELSEALQRLPKPQRGMHMPTLVPRRLNRLSDKFWPIIAREQAGDLDLKSDFRRAVLKNGRVMGPHLEALEKYLPADRQPREYLLEVLLSVAEQPSSWTEQLIAVRTIQSLSILDITGYEHIIRDLGGFANVDSRGQALAASAGYL